MSAIATLLSSVIKDVQARHPDRPPLIGVAGAQGSGKSFQCRQFSFSHPHVAHFSLDDVYFTKAERTELAHRFHPLFATRGPPGTHDLALAERTIAALRTSPPPLEGEGVRGWGGVPLPRFDKAIDDRAPERHWPCFTGRPEAILFDGWCLGALPDELGPAPLNALEAEADAEGRWRARIRADLAERYQPFFDALDALIYLKAPSWEIVRRWRGQQEAETLGRPLTSEDETRLERFLMHYERITRSMLAGRHRARWIVHLDDTRNVVRVEERS